MLHQHTVSDAELNLDNGGYTSIDAFITPPYTRQVISAYNNQLSEYPAALRHCTSLRVLNLSCNQLAYIPPDIAQLTACEMLDLGHNCIADVPPEIGELHQLQYLYLSEN